MVLHYKDLGFQVGYRTVFLVEYAGPLLIHLLFVLLRPFIYAGGDKPMTLTQNVAFACVAFHFLKREYESIFVHRFSHATMPVFNIFKNSFHYWILSGVAIAYFLYSPLYTAPLPDNAVYGLAALFVVCTE